MPIGRERGELFGSGASREGLGLSEARVISLAFDRRNQYLRAVGISTHLREGQPLAVGRHRARGPKGRLAVGESLRVARAVGANRVETRSRLGIRVENDGRSIGRPERLVVPPRWSREAWYGISLEVLHPDVGA